MFNLPVDIQNLIYSYDNTYKLKFDEVLKKINKKNVSMFKYSNKYKYCKYCNVYVQNINRHSETIKCLYNGVHDNKFLSNILTKILKYIKKHKITFEFNYQMNFMIYNTEVLEHYEILHLDNNDVKALNKLINHYINGCATFHSH